MAGPETGAADNTPANTAPDTAAKNHRDMSIPSLDAPC